MNPRAQRANKPQSRLEDATGGKPFGECSREELLEACRWFWMARDEARAELAADRAREPNDGSRRFSAKAISDVARALGLAGAIAGAKPYPPEHDGVRDIAAEIAALLAAFLASGDER